MRRPAAGAIHRHRAVCAIILGEDFAFSRLWTKIGGKCMALINEYITHVGEYQFTGRLIDEMVAIPTDSIDTSTKK